MLENTLSSPFILQKEILRPREERWLVYFLLQSGLINMVFLIQGTWKYRENWFLEAFPPNIYIIQFYALSGSLIWNHLANSCVLPLVEWKSLSADLFLQTSPLINKTNTKRILREDRYLKIKKINLHRWRQETKTTQDSKLGKLSKELSTSIRGMY